MVDQPKKAVMKLEVIMRVINEMQEQERRESERVDAMKAQSGR